MTPANGQGAGPSPGCARRVRKILPPYTLTPHTLGKQLQSEVENAIRDARLGAILERTCDDIYRIRWNVRGGFNFAIFAGRGPSAKLKTRENQHLTNHRGPPVTVYMEASDSAFGSVYFHDKCARNSRRPVHAVPSSRCALIRIQ